MILLFINYRDRQIFKIKKLDKVYFKKNNEFFQYIHDESKKNMINRHRFGR